jgi:hypothetical protein
MESAMTFKNSEYQLLDNVAATGAAFDWPGGKGVFTVYSATFGGGTVKLEWSPDAGSTWLDVDASGDTYVTLTAVGAGLFELPPCQIRAHVATATAVYAKAFGVE